MTETLRRFKEETGFTSGRRADHNSRVSLQPFYHPFPKVPSNEVTTCPGHRARPRPFGPSGALRLVPVLRVASLQLLFAHLAGTPLQSQLRLWSFFLPPMCIQRDGDPRSYSYSLPLGRASQDPGPTNPDSIMRQIPASQGPTLSVECTCGCNMPWCPQFPELMSQFSFSISTAVLRA